jgi:nicotinamide mononucleotide transporter
MNGLEAIAALCGVINSVLLARRSIWNFPFGMAMVALYAIVFFNARLYAVAGLQIFFFIAQIIGLVAWYRAPSATGETEIRDMPAGWWLPLIITGIALSACLALLLGRTDAAAPVTDGSVAAFSLVAQGLTNGRYLQSWPLWTGINIVSVALYAGQNLWLTAGLYAILLGIALYCWWSWHRILNGSTAA